MTRTGVVVAGGGLAGLSAALELVDAGIEVTLVEARPRLGGATSSFEREGLSIDTGQHVFLRCCSAYRAFLRRLGVESLTDLQPRLDIPVLRPGRAPARLRRARLPAPLHLAPALATYSPLSPGERLAAVRAALALRDVDPRGTAADGQTFGGWLRAHGQSQRAIEALWDLIGLPTLNLPAEEAGLAMAAKVFRTGLLEASSAADLGVPRVPLAALHAAPAARALRAAGARIRLGAKVRTVTTGPEGATGVVVEAAAGGDREEIEAGAVIVAVPNDRAGGLLPAGAVADPDAFERLSASPIVNVHVVYDRTVCRHRFCTAIGSPVQWVFDRTGPAGVTGGAQYLAISLSGAAGYVDRPVDDLRREFLPALAALFPPAGEARVERFLVTRERTATFRQAPGSEALRPRTVTRLPGLFLAGAWTDTGWPATMEGAVRSGRTAARRAISSLGRAPAATVGAAA